MFCVAVGLAGGVPFTAQLRPLAATAAAVLAPAQPGKVFSKNGTGWIWLTGVPRVPLDCGAAAAFERMVADGKYVVLDAGSVGLAGRARTSCKGKRRAMVPT